MTNQQNKPRQQGQGERQQAQGQNKPRQEGRGGQEQQGQKRQERKPR